MIRLLFLLLLGEAWAQETISFEFGFRGAIPEVFTDDLTMERGGAVVSVNQRGPPSTGLPALSVGIPGFRYQCPFQSEQILLGGGLRISIRLLLFPPSFRSSRGGGI